MVALKRHVLRGQRAIWLAKQERRGGIETGVGLGDGVTNSGGSRNAVVALKLAALRWVVGSILGSRNAVVALKPANPSMVTISPIREAGTPWWH